MEVVAAKICDNTHPGIANSGTLTVNQSIICSNMGGVYNASGDTATVSNSTISGNSTGVYNYGSLTLENSTVSGNTSRGVYAGAGEGTATIVNTTIFDNFRGVDAGSTVRVRNSILAGSWGGADASGTFISEGHNLVEDGSGTGWIGSDLLGVDPLLGPLADNGGVTMTHALLPGSPAIDAGDNSDVSPTDQRGYLRIWDGDASGTSTVDMGAFEVGSVWGSRIVVDDGSVLEGDAGTVEAVFTVRLLESSPLVVTVDYATMDHAATIGGDYEGVSGTLTFAPGEMLKTVAVTVHGDTEIEPNETFHVQLSNPGNGVFGDDRGSIAIVNDDWTGFVVNSFDDDVDADPGDGVALTSGGVTTLRAAIMESNALEGDQVVMVPAGTYRLSRAGTGEDGAATGDLDVTDTSGSLTILGAGWEFTVIDADRIDRVFHVQSEARASLSWVTVTGGGTPGGDGAEGVFNTGGTVDLNAVKVCDNSDRGVANSGTLTVNQSILCSNTTGIYNSSTGTATVSNSTISGNVTGIYNDGSFTLENSTVSGSTSRGVYAGSGEGTTTIINTTIFDNSRGVDAESTVHVRNSILAGSWGGADASGTFISEGYNLVEDGSGAGWIGSDLLGVDPLLGPLADNGGLTMTHALLPGSLAIDAGDNGDAAPADQRGFLRIWDGDASGTSTVDVGAFEFGSVWGARIVVDDVSVAEGDAGTVEAVFTVRLLESSPLVVTVDYATVDHAATTGGDYEGLSGTLTFAPGEMLKTVAVTVHGDTEIEPNETFYVQLSNADNGVLADDRGSIAIVNDDWTGFVVNSFDDDVDADPGDGVALTGSGVTTLRAAIMEANALEGDQVVMVPAGTYRLSRAGENEDAALTGDLDVTDTTGSLTILGAGLEFTVIDADRIDRVFHVQSAARASFSWVTVTGGGRPSGGGDEGIRNTGGTVDLNAVKVCDNTYPGVANSGTLTVSQSILSSNTVGIYNSSSGAVSVSDSTISGNSQGIYNYGSVTLENSTVSGNTSSGVYANAGGTARIINTTIVDNSRGVYAYGTVHVRNSILAGSWGGADASGTFISEGHNLVGDGSGTGWIGSDQVGVDPLLGTLADNGGLTMTHALLPGSPAIDAGDNSDVAPTDQRGFLRIWDGDGNGTSTVDVGAFEFDSVPVTQLAIDYGDAPDGPYPTLLASNGARHTATGPTLGANRDTESDGQPNASAAGDDTNGAPNDEDGVTVGALTQGETVNLTIDVGGATGYVDAWIDFNADGDWLDAGEKIHGDQLAVGTHQIAVTVPTDATPGTTYARFRVSTVGGLDPDGAAADGEVEDYAVTIQSTVIDRHVFYDGSYYDDGDDNNAVATDKEALLPGGTATFDNYISYARFRGGQWAATLNGTMIDIGELAGTVTAADFEFRTGNNNAPGGWVAAVDPTSVTVHEDEGTGNSDRVKVIWAETAISNSSWLQVTVLANANTGLAAPDVFYFGLAAGECGNSASDAYVDGTDFAYARDNPHNILNRAAIDDRGDYNRDSYVDGSDLVIVRDNNTNIVTDLNLIVVPAAPTAPDDAYLDLPPIDPYVDVDDPASEDEYEYQYEYDDPYQPALEEGDPWESAELEALLADAVWAYEMEDEWSDFEADDPLDEDAVDDLFTLYYTE
ncbi:choice-of-anchor Q domain-containing protein [Planctomycetota bacterium]